MIRQPFYKALGSRSKGQPKVNSRKSKLYVELSPEGLAGFFPTLWRRT